jgi:hypothetical protein
LRDEANPLERDVQIPPYIPELLVIATVIAGWTMEMGMLHGMNLIVAAAALYLNGETGQTADTWAFLERLLPRDQLAAAIQGFDQYRGAVTGGGLPGLLPRTSGHNNYNHDAAIHMNWAWRHLLQMNRKFWD